MSALWAAFLWCLVAVCTGLVGLLVVFSGLWEVGTLLLIIAALSGRTAHVLGRN